MKYTFSAHTNSTDNLILEKEFKSELALKRFLNKFLPDYGFDAWAEIKRPDGRRARYTQNRNNLTWN